MGKLFMPDATPQERLEALRTNAHKMETGNYIKELDAEEIYARREDLERVCIDLQKKAEEKRDWMDTWKSDVKPLAIKQETLIKELKTKQVEVKGDQYLMANYQDGLMEYYDEQGELIYSRKLRPDEKQSRMIIPAGGFKTGTHD